MQIIFNIPADKVQRVVDAINGLYPIPPDLVEIVTPQQWAKERLRQFVINTVLRYEQKMAADQAKGEISPDDDLIT